MASSSSPGCWKYDVFLSFKGEDTRKTFVDHLYSALVQHGIHTFKDDETLDRGDTIGPSLSKAIDESQILVIIFSENYADSSWCLDELSHIMKCRDSETGQIVMPVFYHVDPMYVRKEKRKYEEAFSKHELAENSKNKVESWKKALVDASNIAGWEPKHIANGHEAKCIKEIVGSILDKLSSLDSVAYDENLIGMGIRLEQLKSQLRIGSGGVHMVGIWGVGGGGKTTLATSIYMELKISSHFDGCCFVGNIREESKQHHGLQSLQENILSSVFGKKIQVQSVDIGKQTIKSMLRHRKVFIVLDDVDHLDQLKALAGYREWFGDGSRIVITTRDEHLLTTHRVGSVYPINLLSRDEAIQLFKKHAYDEDKPLQDYEMLSQHIVSYAAGLPLALIVLGSFLYDKDKDEWLSTLARLKDHPDLDIMEKLKISYDGLRPLEKELFLDIACFYRWKNKDEAMEILEACGLHPCIGVKVLIQKSLITISEYGRFDMHDLVEEMGHYIVRGEHPNNPEKHSRVWRSQEIKDMCSRNATTENGKIEAINYNDFVSPSSFMMLVSNMKKLRLLSVRIERNYDEGPSFLSNDLMYIKWENYPASLFPESFQPTKLVVLQMHGSLQKELWKGYKYLPCLKDLELSSMEGLVRTPDFGELPCLEKLILKHCGSLEEIHQSLGNHVSLIHVCVSFCVKLTRFPSIVRMEKLKILEISNCKALLEFPKIEANMDNLVELSSDDVGIEVLPSSVGEYCTNLISLNLMECSDLNTSCIKQFLPQLPCFLRKLNLEGCGLKDGEIPNEIGELSNLQELHLGWNNFTRLDFSFSKLTLLKLLDLGSCWNLIELPVLPSCLAILIADWCESLEALRDDVYTNCKWLCKVSITEGSRVIGGDRLLESMIQGKVIENNCMSLTLEGYEIANWFEPRLVKGGICRMQLPENWYNHFSGFLMCAVFNTRHCFYPPAITMKHEEMGDSQHDLYWEETVAADDDSTSTWVGYIPFGLLTETSFWNETSTAIQIEIELDDSLISGCGFKLLPKICQTETTATDSSSFGYSDDYTCPFKIQHDSKHALKSVFSYFV